jgi:hypothetical protein
VPGAQRVGNGLGGLALSTLFEKDRRLRGVLALVLPAGVCCALGFVLLGRLIVRIV